MNALHSVLAAVTFATLAVAQQPTPPSQFALEGPRFLSAPTHGGPPVDMSAAPALQRRVSLFLDAVPLSAALAEIGRQTGLHFGSSPQLVPLNRRVTVNASNLTVGAALFELLAGLGIDVLLSPDGTTLVLAPRALPAVARHALGRLSGHVTDATSGKPIPYARIVVEGTRYYATTAANGEYVISDIGAGTYRVTARLIGYASMSRSVTVSADSIVVADFALTATPTKLDEVVTTAVGDQRRYQIGNDIGTINVDSLAPTTPVLSLTDVISARVPGVEVLESNGEVGNGPALRIRGQGSLVLQGDPIIIVDGVRQDNTPGGAVAPMFADGTAGFGAIPAPSRLNDIDFDDVASIDILKGPSASTEYGTDAANGVIVIKTKHSQAGAPRWTLQAEQSASEVGTTFPKTYYAYGHTTGANPQPTQCPMIPNVDNVGVGWTAGTCTVDSLVQFTTLNNPSTTLFGIGSREKLDLSVAGGSDAVRYYVAGGLTNETGTLQMPPALRGVADSVGLPKSDWRPNSDDQRSARANTIIRLNPTSELQVSGAYLATDQQAPQDPTLYEIAYTALPVDDAADTYGWNTPTASPVYEYGQLVGQNTQRLTGSLALNWTPLSWFQAHATAGVDHGSQHSLAEVVPQIAYPGLPGELGITNGTLDIYSFDLRGAATKQLTSIVRSITSMGVQEVDTRQQATYSQSADVTTTNPTLDGSVSPLITQTGQRQATLGGYLEEQIGLWDRLFLTGAARVDAGSNFGSGYHSTTYPKASVSWLVLSGGATSVRLRGAYGQSGVQPPPGAALELYSPQAVVVNGTPQTSAGIVNVVNANLQPEHTSEFEGGTDLGFWHDRVNVGLTGYAKRTGNALVPTGVGWEAGGFNAYENIGVVTNNGFEANVSATVLQSRETTWEMTLNGSTNHNDLVELAPGLQPQFLYGDHALMRFAPGTPLYGYAAEKEHFTNLDHTSIVEPNEVSVDDSLSYAGPSQPTIMASYSTHLGLLRGVLTFGALFDYRGGFRLCNTLAFHSATYAQTDLASNDPHAPLWEQLRDVATNIAYSKGLDDYAPSAGFYEDASYVRFRELSATLALPVGLAHAAHVKTLSLTGAIRNLALWTPYTGGDPEVTSSEGGGTIFQPTTNSLVLNHDVREGAQAVPLSRYFVLRLNAGF